MKADSKIWVVNVIPDATQAIGYRYEQGVQRFDSLPEDEQKFLKDSAKIKI